MSHLINKYNVPGPRYTSYPTVSYWNVDVFSVNDWKTRIKKSFDRLNEKEGVSIYIHLPFCESLCTFCGCNKYITKRHEVEKPYIDALLKEWKLYQDLLVEKPVIKEIHLGGGTPTFFSYENINRLIIGILNNSTLSDDYSFSFEGHPNNTTKEHLQSLYDIGFRRVSFGVQDYNETVQKAIHRIQPFEHVKKVTETARKIGYTSVGHDIIFGLPFQNEDHIIHTLQKTRELLPDRIAFYSYAHVPWIKGNGQRGFNEADLPPARLKRKQYETGKKILHAMGYTEIGMDHFALPHDELYKSMKNNTLHRNFMGYTTTQSKIMIGLGVSAISDSWTAFAQNDKSIKNYYSLLNRNELPVHRGHLLSQEDKSIRQHILNLMCQLNTTFEPGFLEKTLEKNSIFQLQELETENIIVRNKNNIRVTETGRPYLRNACMAFDLHLQKKHPETRLFSMTV